MEKLQSAIGVFDEKLAQLALLIAEEKQKGQDALKRKASKAMLMGHARCVRALESQHDNIINMKTNLMQRLIAEESTAIAKTYADAMGSCLKQKGVDMNRLQKTIDGAADRMDDAAELSELVSEPLSNDTFDDEILALFGTADGSSDGGTAQATEAPTVDPQLPAVPKHPPVSAEEKALEAALAGLGV